VIRLAEALEAQIGALRTHEIFCAAGQAQFLAAKPQSMVDERAVTALYASLRSALGPGAAAAAARRAGELTGDYLLAHRIPGAVRGLLQVLPARMAAPLLIGAIRRNARTFAGSGTFAATGRPLRLSITGCPICRGAASPHCVCDYYAATFERLFATLVSPRCRVRESACQATGEPACVFEVTWCRQSHLQPHIPGEHHPCSRTNLKMNRGDTGLGSVESAAAAVRSIRT
jgi:divinyl protochlorophyllide a 8-vinyl-reductase